MILLEEQMIDFWTDQQAGIFLFLSVLIVFFIFAASLAYASDKYRTSICFVFLIIICIATNSGIALNLDRCHEIQVTISEPQQLCQLLEDYNLIRQDGVIFTLHSKQIYKKNENISYVDNLR